MTAQPSSDKKNSWRAVYYLPSLKTPREDYLDFFANGLTMSVDEVLYSCRAGVLPPGLIVSNGSTCWQVMGRYGDPQQLFYYGRLG